MTCNKRIVRIDDKNKVSYYERAGETNKYEMIDDYDNRSEFCYRIIGNRNRSNIVTVYGEIEINDNENGIEGQEEDELPSEIKNTIMNRRAVVATDALMHGNFMATHWTITTLEQEINIEGRIESNTWAEGIVPVGEAIGVLDVIKYVVKRTRNITGGELVVYSDNKTIINNINKPAHKESNVTGEAGAIITAIKDKIEKAPITISIEYANNKPRPGKTFIQ